MFLGGYLVLDMMSISFAGTVTSVRKSLNTISIGGLVFGITLILIYVEASMVEESTIPLS